jgi:hypothetical protein
VFSNIRVPKILHTTKICMPICTKELNCDCTDFDEIWCLDSEVCLANYIKPHRSYIYFLFEHYLLSYFYLKQHFGDWTVPHSSGKMPAQLGQIDRASPCLRRPEPTQVRKHMSNGRRSIAILKYFLTPQLFNSDSVRCKPLLFVDLKFLAELVFQSCLQIKMILLMSLSSSAGVHHGASSVP